MNDEISKSRIRRIVRLRKQRKAFGGGGSFRNGTPLAVFYISLVVAVSLAMSLMAPGSIGAMSADAPPLHTVAVDMAVMVCAVICGRLALGWLAPEVLARNSRILMLGTVAAFSDLLCAAALHLGTEYFAFAMPGPRSIGDNAACAHVAAMFLPYLFAPALATLLAGIGAGMSLGLAMAVQNVLFVPHSAGLSAALCGVFAAVSAPLAVAGVHRRGPLASRLAALGLVQIFGLFFAIWAVPGFGTRLCASSCSDPGAVIRFARISLFAVALALAAAPAAALALLPALERLFATCSAIKLDHWADLSNPLLRRLSLEAPGTFHHSLMVANLAETAAEAVGADPLLARVGAYYHDIGKLSAPEKFTENIGFGGVNPHDSLSPAMSALVLAAHVRDGMAMADADRLPAPIRAIIAEHHGTSSMAYFLDKARRQAEAKAAETDNREDAASVDENRFRYAGPRPGSAESAIIMLADSVEAASRSIPNPDPAVLEKKVDAVVSAKIRDGQLDASPLTFADVVEIRRSFSSTLATALHGRISYPGDKPGEGKDADGDARKDAADRADNENRGGE
ncbi:MAG: HDIG domain-containing protein [Kiritimatiellae bacterium]|nr:HDIG domain-containing protein [Kiritimatiellia bacterium]